MGRNFEVSHQIAVASSPEVIWDAIATGPGIDCWFMGHNEVEPGPAGVVRTVMGDYRPELAITAWDPGTRLAYREAAQPDGRFIAYEFLIEGRDAGSTVLRMVTSGFLPDDDWEDEYDAMSKGLQMFLRTLAEYINHFTGRKATVITAFGPQTADWHADWAKLHQAFGLTAPAAIGAPAVLHSPGLPNIEGVVYFTNPDTIGIRTADAIYRFLGGFHGPIVAAHHLFADTIDQTATESAWQTWLGQVSA
jgi:uncharacterized protein YndB with AHSA1/START domain